MKDSYVVRATAIDEKEEPLLCLALSIEVGEKKHEKGETMSSEWTRPDLLGYQV